MKRPPLYSGPRRRQAADAAPSARPAAPGDPGGSGRSGATPALGAQASAEPGGDGDRRPSAANVPWRRDYRHDGSPGSRGSRVYPGQRTGSRRAAVDGAADADRAAAAGDGPAAAGTGGHPNRDRRGRFWLPLVGAMAGVIVAMSYPSLAPQGWPGSRAGRDDPLSQERVDEAVVHSLQTVTLPSMAARAAQILAPSVVRVRSFGPPEEEGPARDPPRRDEKRDEKRDGSNRDAGGGGQTGPNRDGQREQADVPADVPRDGGRRRSATRSRAEAPTRSATPSATTARTAAAPSVSRARTCRTASAPGSSSRTDGLILSNLHVVSGRAPDHRRSSPTAPSPRPSVTGARPEHDLAVLKAKTLPDDLQPATLRSTGDLSRRRWRDRHRLPVRHRAVGELRRHLRASTANTARPVANVSLTNLIQFDAAANPGNSGGPLATMEGEVVGIVTAILNPNNQRSFVGIGFAVPIENAAAAAGLPPH